MRRFALHCNKFVNLHKRYSHSAVNDEGHGHNVYPHWDCDINLYHFSLYVEDRGEVCVYVQ